MRTRNTKYPPFLAILMMTLALVGCNRCEDYVDEYNLIEAQNSPQAIDESGTATLRFLVYWDRDYAKVPVTDITVTFTATNGTCTASAETDANGEAVCVFKAANPVSFEGGTVTAVTKRLNHNSETGSMELGYMSAEAVVLPLLRPSKSKTKPRIGVVEEPVTGEDGKTLFRVRLTEQEVGDVKEEPLPGREVRFETDQEKGTVTEKAITDKNGEAGAEFEPKDPGSFEGADVTAKATVKYSDGDVDVETKITIQKPVETGYRLTAQESPQKVRRLGNDCVFLLEKLTDGKPEPLGGVNVTFTAEGGEIDAAFKEGTTNADGLVRTFFRAGDIIGFEEGRVTASATVEGESAQGFVDMEPADIGLKFDWKPSYQSPDYSDGKADYTLNIKYTIQEQGQEVVLADASEGEVSIETDGEGEILAPEGAGAFSFSGRKIDIQYGIDKEKYAESYSWKYPGDKIKVRVQSLKELTKLPESGTTTEALVNRFSPALVVSSSSPNKIDDKNKCTVKFTFTDQITGNPLKVKAKFEAEGGKCTEEAESDNKGEIGCEFEMDEKSLLVGGKITCTVTELAYTGSFLSSIMPVTHQATVDPLDLTYKIEPLQAEYGYDPKGEATVTFQLSGKEEATGLTFTELPGRVIRFQTTNGSTDASGDWKTTDAHGRVTVSFTGKDVTSNGIIKARHEYNKETGGLAYAYSPDVPILPMDYMLRCINSPQMADQSGAAELRFELNGINGYSAELYPNVPGRVIYLTPTNGGCAPEVTTNNDGKVTIAFQLTDLEAQGTVDALFTYKVNGVEKQEAALGIVEPYEEITDEGLKKANKLKDNVYVIEQDGARQEVTVGDLPEGEGMRDYILHGEKKDGDKTMVHFLEFCKEHPVYATVGGGTIHIRPDQIGKEIDMLKEDPKGLCWMNLFSLQDVNQGYSETNPDTSFSAPGNPDIVEAKCKFTQNPDGSMTGLAYFKKKDGTEGYFKMKATRKAGWSD